MQPQKIRIGERLEVKTNSVIMVVIICALFTLSPLGLAYWKPDLKNYKHMDEIEKDYISYKDLSLSIIGQVYERKIVIENQREIEKNEYADSDDIILEQKIDDDWQVIKTETTDRQGSFNFLLPPPPVRLNDKYRITWKKIGFKHGKETFLYSWKNCEIHLKKEGD